MANESWFSAEIEEWLDRHGMSMEELAFSAGISSRAMRKIVSGDISGIPHSILHRIYQVAGIKHQFISNRSHEYELPEMAPKSAAKHHIPSRAILKPIQRNLKISATTHQNSITYTLTHHYGTSKQHMTVHFTSIQP
jgi:plasmid maintenance system antidote protein VapI